MLTRSGLAALVALLFAAGPTLAQQPPAGPPPEIALLEPAPGTEVLRPTYRVRASVRAHGEVTARVVIEWPGSRHREVPMQRLEDGTFVADGITVLAPASVRVRDAAGRETRLAVEVVDRSGYVEGPSVPARGTPVGSVEAKDAQGRPVGVPPSPAPCLVLFHAAWDHEVELAWLEEIQRVYGPRGLSIVAVASVAPGDVARWRERLAERKAGWTSVADPDGSVAAAFGVPARKVVGNGAVGSLIFFVAAGELVDATYMLTDELAPEERGPDDETYEYVARALERLLAGRGR